MDTSLVDRSFTRSRDLPVLSVAVTSISAVFNIGLNHYGRSRARAHTLQVHAGARLPARIPYMYAISQPRIQHARRQMIHRSRADSVPADSKSIMADYLARIFLQRSATARCAGRVTVHYAAGQSYTADNNSHYFEMQISGHGGRGRARGIVPLREYCFRQV